MKFACTHSARFASTFSANSLVSASSRNFFASRTVWALRRAGASRMTSIFIDAHVTRSVQVGRAARLRAGSRTHVVTAHPDTTKFVEGWQDLCAHLAICVRICNAYVLDYSWPAT